MLDEIVVRDTIDRVRAIVERKILTPGAGRQNVQELGELAIGAVEHALDQIKQRDVAYTERNHLVAALGRMVLVAGGRVGVKRTEIDGWDTEWQNCIYIDGPTGQLSWHYRDSEAELFKDFPVYTGEWDGHKTAEKYARVDELLGVTPNDPPAPAAATTSTEVRT